jgi:hypothetical protein
MAHELFHFESPGLNFSVELPSQFQGPSSPMTRAPSAPPPTMQTAPTQPGNGVMNPFAENPFGFQMPQMPQRPPPQAQTGGVGGRGLPTSPSMGLTQLLPSTDFKKRMADLAAAAPESQGFPQLPPGIIPMRYPGQLIGQMTEEDLSPEERALRNQGQPMFGGGAPSVMGALPPPSELFSPMPSAPPTGGFPSGGVQGPGPGAFQPEQLYQPPPISQVEQQPEMFWGQQAPGFPGGGIAPWEPGQGLPGMSGTLDPTGPDQLQPFPQLPPGPGQPQPLRSTVVPSLPPGDIATGGPIGGQPPRVEEPRQTAGPAPGLQAPAQVSPTGIPGVQVDFGEPQYADPGAIPGTGPLEQLSRARIAELSQPLDDPALQQLATLTQQQIDQFQQPLRNPELDPLLGDIATRRQQLGETPFSEQEQQFAELLQGQVDEFGQPVRNPEIDRLLGDIATRRQELTAGTRSPEAARFLSGLGLRQQQLRQDERSPEADRLLQELGLRQQQLRAPVFSDVEENLIRTKALDRISRLQDQAEARQFEQLGALGRAPTSGVNVEVLRGLNEEFNRLRSQAEGDFGRFAIGERQRRLDQALGLGQERLGVEETEIQRRQQRLNEALGLGGQRLGVEETEIQRQQRRQREALGLGEQRRGLEEAEIQRGQARDLGQLELAGGLGELFQGQRAETRGRLDQALGLGGQRLGLEEAEVRRREARDLQTLGLSEGLSRILKGTRQEEAGRRGEALNLANMLAQLSERRLALMNQTLGQEGGDTAPLFDQLAQQQQAAQQGAATATTGGYYATAADQLRAEQEESFFEGLGGMIQGYEG